MKILNNIGMISIFVLLIACNQEDLTIQPAGEGDEIRFGATLSQSAAFSTKAEAVANPVPLPYINGIYVCKQEDNQNTTSVYYVKNGNKGTLVAGSHDGSTEQTVPLEWKDKVKDIPFITYTTPTGVTMEAGDNPTSGSVNFVAGNKKTSEEKDKLNTASVAPLEVFISAEAKANYPQSPSVTLPFKHLVSKLSIRVRDWNYRSITPTSITFFAIPDKWTVEQREMKALKITKAETGADVKALTLPFSDLEKTAIDKTDYYLMYLPPLISGLESSFASAGDFVIEYDSKKYYGTLKGIKPSGGDYAQQIEGELQAGEHMSITMDLSENFGVGVGPHIVDWNGPDGEELIYGQPHKGIYTLEGLRLVAEAINKGESVPDSLIDGSAIRLYNNIKLTGSESWLPIGTKDHPFTGTFDGQGYTISGLTGATGLFGTAGNASASSATIRNLRLSGTITGTADGIALLIDTATNTTVTNCHVIGTSSVSNASATAGGLIGIANTGTTVSQCSFTGTISGNTTIGGIVGSFAGSEISNCFVSETGTAITPINIAGSNTAGTIKNCYSVIKKDNAGTTDAIGYYWKEVSSNSIEKSTEFYKDGTFSSQFESWTTLLKALNANSGFTPGISWVYVYGKDFPVMRIE